VPARPTARRRQRSVDRHPFLFFRRELGQASLFAARFPNCPSAIQRLMNGSLSRGGALRAHSVQDPHRCILTPIHPLLVRVACLLDPLPAWKACRGKVRQYRSFGRAPYHRRICHIAETDFAFPTDVMSVSPSITEVIRCGPAGTLPTSRRPVGPPGLRLVAPSAPPAFGLISFPGVPFRVRKPINDRISETSMAIVDLRLPPRRPAIWRPRNSSSLTRPFARWSVSRPFPSGRSCSPITVSHRPPCLTSASPSFTAGAGPAPLAHIAGTVAVHRSGLRHVPHPVRRGVSSSSASFRGELPRDARPEECRCPYPSFPSCLAPFTPGASAGHVCRCLPRPHMQLRPPPAEAWLPASPPCHLSRFGSRDPSIVPYLFVIFIVKTPRQQCLSLHCNLFLRTDSAHNLPFRKGILPFPLASPLPIEVVRCLEKTPRGF
jgi:hypothetical protein